METRVKVVELAPSRFYETIHTLECVIWKCPEWCNCGGYTQRPIKLAPYQQSSANAVVCSKHGPYGPFDSICPKCSAEHQTVSPDQP